ncbi:MAG TPA: hypothetical protein VGE94_02385 [Chloroflexota bacterium]
MSSDNPTNVILVPVKRYDVNLTLEDILTPLTQTTAPAEPAAAPTLIAADTAATPELAQLLRQLADLAAQMKYVVAQINRIDPTVLAPGSSTAAQG